MGLGPLLLVTDSVAATAGVLTHPWSWRLVLLFGVALVTLLGTTGLDRSRLSMGVLDDLPRLVGRWLAALSIAIGADIVRTGYLGRDYTLDWGFLGASVEVGVVVVALRGVVYSTVQRLRRSGRLTSRTVVVGAGAVGRQVVDILREHPEYGLVPVGFLDTDPSLTSAVTPLPVFGPPSALSAVIDREQVDDVVVAFSADKESGLVELIRTCDRHRCELFVVPRLFEVLQVDVEMEDLWGLPLVRLRRGPYRSPAWRLKRLVDVAFSATALFVLAPLLGALALAVRLDGGPGVLFRQERMGADGRSFTLLKFRTLRPLDDADSDTTWCIAGDERMSRTGRLLRTSSLDELPQLLNVLRGDMSLVGPRPERPHFVSQYREAYPSYHARHRVPAGLTGWAQVHGLRGDTSIADRARFDNYYIQNWSIWLDTKIILRTLVAVVIRPGA